MTRRIAFIALGLAVIATMALISYQNRPNACAPNCNGENLSNRDLRGVDFKQADLSQANLNRTVLSYALIYFFEGAFFGFIDFVSCG